MKRVVLAKELVKLARILSADEVEDDFSYMLKVAALNIKNACLQLIEAADYAKRKKGRDSESAKFAMEMDKRAGAVLDVLKRNLDKPLS
jgi:hypothetical protein